MRMAVSARRSASFTRLGIRCRASATGAAAEEDVQTRGTASDESGPGVGAVATKKEAAAASKPALHFSCLGLCGAHS